MSVPVVSIVHEYVAGVASVIPAASVARTAKVCVPSARLLYAFGDAHAVKPAPSRLHVKVDGVSVDTNANDGDQSFDGSLG